MTLRRFILPAALLLLATACRKDSIEEDSFALFNDSALPSLTVSVSGDEWKRLLDLYDADSNTKDYVRCDVRFESGGRKYSVQNAGLRLRGQTSRRRPQGHDGNFHHFHAGIHLRKFEPGNPEIDGFRRFNLKYAKEDPTYVREHYCYDLLSRYGVWTSPRSSWCRLTLQAGGPLLNYGVYLMVESIDKQYLKRRPQFGSPDGFLWKCAPGANLRDWQEGRCHLDDNSTRTWAYELKDDSPEAFETAKRQLRDFITKFNSYKGDVFREWAREAIDVPLLLRMYAVNVAVGQWDDYWNNMNNFYLYFNTRDPEHYRMYMLPYDYDNTLGTSNYCGVQSDSGRQDPYNWGISQCTLISKLLTVDEFRSIYTSCLRELGASGNQWFSFEKSTERIRAWQALLSPWVDNDTGEDTLIADSPASWGNHPEYRLLQDGPANWFRVKCSVLEGL